MSELNILVLLAVIDCRAHYAYPAIGSCQKNDTLGGKTPNAPCYIRTPGKMDVAGGDIPVNFGRNRGANVDPGYEPGSVPVKLQA